MPQQVSLVLLVAIPQDQQQGVPSDCSMIWPPFSVFGRAPPPPGAMPLMDRSRLLQHAMTSIIACSHMCCFSALLGNMESVTTLFDGGNALVTTGGVYFDLQGTGADGVTVTGFDFNIQDEFCSPNPSCPGPFSVDVHTRIGTASGQEGSADGWNLVGSRGMVTPEAGNMPTPFRDIVSFSVMPGEIVGVAVVASFDPSANNGIEYTNGDGTNEVYLSDDGLLQVTGLSSGLAPGEGAGGINSPRVINTNVYYDPQTSTDCRLFCKIVVVIKKVICFITFGLVCF